MKIEQKTETTSFTEISGFGATFEPPSVAALLRAVADHLDSECKGSDPFLFLVSRIAIDLDYGAVKIYRNDAD